jgi:ribonuclease HI
LRFGPVTGEVRVPTKARPYATRIHETGKRIQVRIEWVRGHSGDSMNETADRLAVLARRSVRAGLGREATEATATRIFADHLAGTSQQATSAA